MIAPSEFSTLDPELAGELRAAFDRVMRSGWYVLGPEVEAFEREFAAWVGAPHAVGVASGTDALQLSLAALGIGAGDEVILPSNALPAAYGVAASGCSPRFCDARPDDLNLDPDDVLALVGPRTRAVVAVHLYGHPVDVPALRRALAGSGVAVVEDCAQAHGAEVDGQSAGTMGDIAAFSFYPTKNLGAIGDGGAVVTSDHELALRVARLRVYGEDRRYHSVALGTNSRLDELQAALLRVKLGHLDGWLERRRTLAASYDELLADLPVELPPCLPGVTHARHLYPLRVSRRDAVLASLREQGVPAAVHYPLGAHDQPCFANARERDLPVTEALGRRLLSLPMHAGLSPEDASRVVAALERALERSAAAAV
jgi:dTDP-3-amino-3,4,6-trideoxy-alpha-D-glucose transaminase